VGKIAVLPVNFGCSDGFEGFAGCTAMCVRVAFFNPNASRRAQGGRAKKLKPRGAG